MEILTDEEFKSAQIIASKRCPSILALHDKIKEELNILRSLPMTNERFLLCEMAEEKMSRIYVAYTIYKSFSEIDFISEEKRRDQRVISAVRSIINGKN